jgi:hypothetical protein
MSMGMRIPRPVLAGVVIWVIALLPLAAAGQDYLCPADFDCDGILNGEDLCPWFATDNQADANGDGTGDACQCGDQSGDGFVDVNDILAVNAAIFNPALATPLCDANYDQLCDVNDILAVNAAIFGAQAVCERLLPNALFYGETKSGLISPAGNVDVYQFQAEEGDLVRIVMATTTGSLGRDP